VTATNTDVEAALGQMPLDVRVEGLKESIEVTAINGVVASAHRFQVLLRHRRRSIPQAP
jgi:hypothetical protein